MRPLAVALLAFLVLTGAVLPLLSRTGSASKPAHGAHHQAPPAELNALLVDEIQGIADLLVVRSGQCSHQARADWR